MNTAINTTYDNQNGTLYFSNEGDEYSCYFVVEIDDDDVDVLFHADQDSFDSFDEFREDIESNFDSEIVSFLFGEN